MDQNWNYKINYAIQIMTDDKKVFEYTEQHYPDQFLKVKIIFDQVNYDIWRSILNDSNNIKNIKSLNCKYKGTLLNEIFYSPLPEKINDLSKEKIILVFR